MTVQDRYYMGGFQSRRRWDGRLEATCGRYTPPWQSYPRGSFTVTAWTDEALARKVHERLVRDGASKSMRLCSHRTMRSHAFGEPWCPPDAGNGSKADQP